MRQVIEWHAQATVEMHSPAEMHFNHAYLSAAGQQRFRHVRGGPPHIANAYSDTCAAAYTRAHARIYTFITFIRWAISHTLQPHYRPPSVSVWPCH